ncbi:unnamed protein product [Zymoseptoria tritici ST99CH_3D1]|nr:unnamed protein product [Zymoseptoria tritici ST99CH_3D1]
MAQDTEKSDNGSLPLKGVVLCCTSLAQEVRTSLAEAAVSMGAVHKLDLTSDVTHLIVGSITTPKYRYVAKERPDIRVLAPSFIDAIRHEWMKGGAVDVETLLDQHTLPPFSGLMICLTGWQDLETRRRFEETIRKNGATYNADLVKQVTHLIAAKPEGAKYTHAKQWGIKVVGLRWFEDSLKRGMALDESLYQAEMPEETQGKGAYRTEPKKPLVKRGRETDLAAGIEEAGRRKLRKVASMRLDQHSQDLWKSVSEHEVQVETTEIDVWNEESQTMQNHAPAGEQQTKRGTESLRTSRNGPSDAGESLLSGIYILLHGFDKLRRERLMHFLEPNGAIVVDCHDALARASENQSFHSRILLVPHADQEKLPDVPPATTVATEWWVERCVHHKRNLDPDQDPLSQPLGQVTVSGFSGVAITTTGFDNVDLRQTAEAVKLMGARYQEQLLPSTSVLVCGDKLVRKEKAFYASKHNIPVVSAKWLWESLRLKTKAPFDGYRMNLPAFDPAEYTGTPSTRGPTPSEPRRSVEDLKRAETSQLKRLSNSRKRHNTPSLIMQPAKVSGPREFSRDGPFILEDDDQDDDETPVVMDEQPPAAPRIDIEPGKAVQPLREISPNKSQPKRGSSAEPEQAGNDAGVKPTMQLPTRTAPVSPEKQLPAKFIEDASSGYTNHDLAANVAELLNKRRVNSNATEPLKRKSRTLGRNLSSSNRTPRSDSMPPNLSEAIHHDEDHYSAADGFSALPVPVVAPPSTQLGYETPEAVAHREQMGRKMGMEGLMREEEGKGVRVGSLGTVRDSERLGGGERKAKARGRK